MTMFDKPELYTGPIDPDAGFLCYVVCWRPKAGASEDDLTGEKQTMMNYIPHAPDQACLCGSGRLFEDCCQPKRLWHPLCPNPGLPEEAGYSKMRAQSATFTHVNADVVRAQLMDDIRLRCTEDAPDSGFWIYEGDPAIQVPHGIMCFGDIELRPNRTLYVTALSDLRMKILLDLLREDCGDALGCPRMVYDALTLVDKRTGKSVTRANPRSRARSSSKRGRRKR